MPAYSAPSNAVPAPPPSSLHALAPNSSGQRPNLHALVWRYGQTLPDAPRGLATGFDALDRVLPQRGWMADGLNELIGNEQGIGEFSLILPALAAVCAERKCVLLANPPFLPYAPALADAGIIFAHLIVVRNADSEQLYWATEQALRSKACGAVVAWSDETARPLSDLLLRRMQVAAAAGHAAGFLFRPRRAREHPSPAALRVSYTAAGGELDLTVIKARGIPGMPRVRIQPWRHPWASRNPTLSTHKAIHHAVDRSSPSRSFAAGEHARTVAAHSGRDH